MERRLVSPIIARIQRDSGVPDLFEALSERLPGTDLQSLLLEVMRARASTRSPADLLAQRRRDATLPPAPVDHRRLHETAGRALDAAEDFEAVALSPVSPAGLNAVLGDVDQNNALATVRGTEVLADPTTALALEAALRRRAGADVVRLCSVDRVLRMQPFQEGWRQHFGIFSLVTAGRSEAGHAFELRALRDHLRVHLRLLAALGRREAAVEVADTSGRLGRVEEGVFAALRREFPDATCRLQPNRTRAAQYYTGLLMEVLIPTPGSALSIADGGMTDWTQRLLSDRKERLFVSGIGIELLGRSAA
jgi:hypothetical protein